MNPHDYAQQLRLQPTDAEHRIWQRLRARQLGWKFRRQVPLCGYIVDFCCHERRLIVELDGGQHADSAYDQERDQTLRKQGYRVLRFWNNDVLTNTDGVMEVILRACEEGK